MKQIFAADSEKEKAFDFICMFFAEVESWTNLQGQGHKKIRGQGQEPTSRGQTLSRPRTAMLEAKDQGHKAQVFFKKKGPQNFFSGDLKKKKTIKLFARGDADFPRKLRRSPEKKVFQKFPRSFCRFPRKVKRRSWPIFNESKKVLSSSRG